MTTAKQRQLFGRRLIAPAAIALLAIAVAAPVAEAATPDRFTPVVAEVVAPPEPVTATDGRLHLAYELLLTNRALPPATITAREVTAQSHGRVLQSLAGAELEAVMTPFGTAAPGAVLERGESAMVLMDISLPRRSAVPKRISHRLSITVDPPSDVIAASYRTAPSRVLRREAIVVAPPLRGGGWVVGNGCCAELTSHRAGLLAVDGGLWAGERFAIDFVQLSPAGLLIDGPPEDLASYAFFGDPVLSATAGKVVETENDLPETPPGELPPANAATAGGNYVTVKVAPDRFAFYAHLQPGSVRVSLGDRVRVGETLGRLGSSGNSNAPHLHFQLMDGPSPLASNGIPYRFDRFSVGGRLTNFAGLFEAQPAEIIPEHQGVHRRELPLNLQVIGFG